MTLVLEPVKVIRGVNLGRSDYVTAAAADDTTPINGDWIDNRDGRVESLGASANVTASSGTSPTLQLTLQGANDPDAVSPVAFDIVDDAAAIIQTTAVDISTPPATLNLETGSSGITKFPPLIRVEGVLGGTTPTWDGTISVHVARRELNSTCV